MNIGVIGTGNWGVNLVQNFNEIGVLAGIADSLEINRNRAKEINSNVEVYESATDLIQSNNYDAVAIATPAHTHYQIAKSAMESGLDVFLEKPMTLDSIEAEDLIQIAEDNDRTLMVGHLLLYQPAIKYLKEALDSNLIGTVYSMHQRRSKLGRARAIENVLWSFGVHDVAVLLYLSGQTPVNISTVGHCGLSKNIEDDAYLHLKFPDGSIAHLHNSWLWPVTERSLTIVGEKGMLVYDEIAQSVTLHKKTINTGLQNVDEGKSVVFEGSENPLLIELKHFLKSCREKSKPISCGKNGLEVVNVLSKAEELLKDYRLSSQGKYLN